MEQEDVDLAVLLVGIPGPDRSSEPTKPIGTLQIAEGQEPPVGQKVYAIGSPQGLEASLSEGMISGRRQEANGPPWLQFTAPVSPGSSGGPLLDATGQVVGVVTAIRRGGQNLNRAVPTSEVIKFLAGPLNSRKLWRGTGIEEADDAYFSARSDAWDAALAKGVEGIEGSGGALLYTADQQIRQQDYSGAMESLAAIVPAQCGRFEFLWHYTIGRAAERRGIKRLGIDDDIVVPDEKYYGQVRMDKDCQLAKEEFRRSIELKPEFCPAYQRLARCLWREGGIGEAFASADWLVRKAPRCTTAYKLRGELNLALKRNRDALADFETAADLGPNSPHTWFSIGKTYSDLGEYEKAIAGYDNAIRLGHTQEGLCQFLVGFEYWDLSKYEQAIARFERARSLGYEPGKCDECIAKCRAAMK
jgi:tetratricopeptide (TPR) repeat protein